MGSGTRSQQGLVHERLPRRVEKFSPIVRQSEALRQVAVQVLNDVAADSPVDADDFAEMVVNLVPGLNNICSGKFLPSPTYPIALLREVTKFYSCLPMSVSAAEGLRDGFKTESPLTQLSWLLVTVHGMPIDDVNLTLDLVARFVLPRYHRCFRSCSAQSQMWLKGPLRLRDRTLHFRKSSERRSHPYLNKKLFGGG